MGFGCNVPAILATRSIKNKYNRLITMLINPFMSCSARLPVYVLFISAFFPKYPGTILFGIYMFGILMAFLIAILMKKTIFRKKETPFVMELPPYRIPAARTILKHMWNRASQYLKKIAGVILIASVIIWVLGYLPGNFTYSKDYDQIINKIEQRYTQLQTTIPPDRKDVLSRIREQKNNEIRTVMIEKESEKLSQTYIGKIGKAMEPIIKPLGFEWRMGIGILSGIAAKEITISTLAVLYQAGDTDEETDETLINKLRNEVYTEGNLKGQKVFTPLIALGFMIFILLYTPCIGVISTIRKESGSWKWAAFTVIYTTILAWLVSFGIYQVGSYLI
jgi:ferrous iron transport protein B